MLISISRYNPLLKSRCLEIVFAEIICKTLLKRNSRTPSILSKIISFAKIASHITKLCYLKFPRKIIVVKKRCLEIAFPEIISETLLKANSRVLSVLSKMVSFVKIPFRIRKLC